MKPHHVEKHAKKGRIQRQGALTIAEGVELVDHAIIDKLGRKEMQQNSMRLGFRHHLNDVVDTVASQDIALEDVLGV